jgi:dTDP-4-amino-4,6-dideoxy-D-galactose acyltransferase
MISRLGWDSEFFGLETGKLVLNGNQFFEFPDPGLFSFIYVLSDRKLTKEEMNVGKGKMHLADEKIVFHKNLISPIVTSANIQSFDLNCDIPDRLYDLAIQSGHYSRFYTDPNLPKSSFEKLYRLWLERSVSRQIADEVYVYETDNIIRGFITLGIKSGRPDIGLVAVNAEDRSLGIGALLLNAAENWAVTNAHMNEIQVVTQGQNTGACRFYEKNGYTIESVKYIYHWWN